MRNHLDETPILKTQVRQRRHVFTITTLEAAALAVRWAAIAFIVAVWMLVAMIVGR